MYDIDDEGKVHYDDAIVLEEDWAQLKAQGWQSPRLGDIGPIRESRSAAADRLAARAGASR